MISKLLVAMLTLTQSNGMIFNLVETHACIVLQVINLFVMVFCPSGTIFLRVKVE